MKVVFLASADKDVLDLRRYINRTFGREVWRKTKAQLSASISHLSEFPLLGPVTEELQDLGLNAFRQHLSGMNRILYEVKDNMVLIHVVCDARRDARTLLTQRLLRAPSP